MSGRSGVVRVVGIVALAVVVGLALYWGLGSRPEALAPEPTAVAKVAAAPTVAPTVAATVTVAASPVVSPTLVEQEAATEAATEAPPTATTQPESPLVAPTAASAAGAAESPLATPVGEAASAATVEVTATLTPTAPKQSTLPERLGLTAPVIAYEVVESYPHDPAAFTQGLVMTDGVLYEGTGLRGASSLRRVDLETGEVLQQIELEPQYFGEGVTVFGDEIIQLTWTEGTAFVYEAESFAREGQFEYTTEGWGLTHDGEQLIMSDGTFVLALRDPETFEQVGSVLVHDGETPIVRLNELEYINRAIYANVWQTDLIARIDPATGAVTGWLDMTELLPAEEREGRQVDVLNGIAYDEASGNLLVTGKLWPKMYEIRLEEGP